MNNPRWMQYCARAAIAAACACAAPVLTPAASAETLTLTFDHIDDAGPYPDSYAEAGFIITSLEPNGPHLHAAGGALALHSGGGSSPYQIRREDGGSFDFLAFDYFGGDSLFVTNTGATFTILGDQPLATFTMGAGFHDVAYVNWYMNNPGEGGPFGEQWGTIDNIITNVPAAPEPAGVAMLGLGLAGVLWRGRRRRCAQKETAA